MNKRNALIILGPPASGKSTLYNNLKGYDDYIYLNVDNYFEDKNSEYYNNLYTSTQYLFKTDLPENILKGNNIILDTTGSSFKKIKGIYTDLLCNDYNVVCCIVITDPATCLIQNFERDRTLPAIVVINEWVKVYSNLDNYKLLFKDKLVIDLKNFIGYEIPIIEVINNFIKFIGGIEYYNSSYRKVDITDTEREKRKINWDKSLKLLNDNWGEIINKMK